MPDAVHIEGLAELQRAFGRVSIEAKRELRNELKVAAEPAREKAEELARDEIRNMTAPWSRVRLGVTQRAVYLAPAVRRRGGSRRPKFARLFRSRALEPAVQETLTEIRERLKSWVDGIGRRAGF